MSSKPPEIPKNQLDILGSSIDADAVESRIPNEDAEAENTEENKMRFEHTVFIPQTSATAHYVQIPRMLNFVWVGNPIPEKYQENLKNWRKYNPDYEITLCVDSDLLTKEQYEAIKKFGKDNRIKIANVVDKIKDPNNKIWYKRDLSAYYDNVVGENRNWAIASNFLRALMLEETGGLYLDTDISPAKKRLPFIIKVPPHGLLLKPLYSPIVEDDKENEYQLNSDFPGALADNIMASTKGNPVVTEFFRLMLEKYQAYLASNESVLAMRSRVLSNIEIPTFKIVGPDVLGEAFANVEMNYVPFGLFLNKPYLAYKLVDKNFNKAEILDFFNDYFSEAFDNTWGNEREQEAFHLYEQLLENAFCDPLLKILTEQKEADVKLDEEYEKIREILSSPRKDSVKKVAEIRRLLKDKEKVWTELNAYFRTSYISSLVMNEENKQKILHELFFVKKDYPAFLTLLDRVMQDKKYFYSEKEESRKFSNPLLLAAATNQHKRIGEILFQDRPYEQYLVSAVQSGLISLAHQLLAMGISCSKPMGPQSSFRANYPNALLVAIHDKHYDLATVMLGYLLGDLKDKGRDRDAHIDAELRAKPQILFQINDNVSYPIIAKYYSAEKNQIIIKPIWFLTDGTLAFEDKGNVVRFDNLSEIEAYIRTQEKLLQTSERDSDIALPESFQPKIEADKPTVPPLSFQREKYQGGDIKFTQERESVANEQSTSKTPTPNPKPGGL